MKCLMRTSTSDPLLQGAVGASLLLPSASGTCTGCTSDQEASSQSPTVFRMTLKISPSALDLA